MVGIGSGGSGPQNASNEALVKGAPEPNPAVALEAAVAKSLLEAPFIGSQWAQPKGGPDQPPPVSTGTIAPSFRGISHFIKARSRAKSSPVGTIAAVAGIAHREKLEDWIPCDGREISAVRYPELAATLPKVLRQAAAGRGMFRVPDLRGHAQAASVAPVCTRLGEHASPEIAPEAVMRPIEPATPLRGG